jgi:hypothetical protein
VQFRLTYTVDAFTNLADQPKLIVSGDPVVVVGLEAHDRDPRDATKPVTLLTAAATMTPPSKAATALHELAAGEMPTGAKVDQRRIDRWGDKPFPPMFNELPGSLQEFSRTVSRLLSDAAVRVFEVLRWRFEIGGPPRPYASRGIEWSDDGETWHSFPTAMHVRASVATIGTPLPPERVQEINDLLDSGAQEPLAHFMLREARASAVRHDVSALVMAMAAAEIGLKQLTAQLVPAATWLVENVPSPPLVRMLIEYLPLLPRVNTEPALVPPPDSVLKALRKGVTIRNSAAHVGARRLDPDDVDEVLNAVHDLLCLFDYYAGQGWALEHLSYDVAVEAGVREPITE